MGEGRTRSGVGTLRRSLWALALACSAALPSPLHPQAIPAPASVLRFEPGADFRLADYEASMAYFQELAAATDRVQLQRVGRTSEGRDWYVALISSPANLRNLEEHLDGARRLADPASLTDEEARSLARTHVAVVDISGGLHATEVAGAQHTLALAYELASSDDPRIAAIREGVITVLWPSLNPDGQTMVADWYASNVGTPYETAPLPHLYQKYVGHDNNRDAYMLNMIESRVLARTWRHFAPQIIYVHHQSSPFPTRIWLPPFAEPIAPRVPPLMSRTVNTLGMSIAQMLESRGMTGATHMGTGFDAWYPGYVDYLPMLQNQAAFWTETALYRYATPHFYTLSDFPPRRRGLRPESLYPSPWRGGWWRLADAVEYMKVASLAVLDWAAKYREDILYNRYQAGRDVVARYRAEGPYAYFVPRDQRDPVAPVELLRRLAFNGIRVHTLRRDVVHEGLTWPAGTWVIPMDQPFAELARQVLEVQRYPDLREYPEGPPEQPYDAAGWTLPYQMDVRVVEATQPLAPDVREALVPLATEPLAWDAEVDDAAPFDLAPGVGFDTDPVAAALRPLPGRLTGSGDALLLDPAQNNSFRALNDAWDAGARVLWDASSGHWQVVGLSSDRAEALAERLALQARRGAATGTPLPRPRVGLYRPWTASMDEGWTRWLLERFGFAFTSLRNADVHAGDLRARYDVIVLPSERPSRLRDGFPSGTVPPRYAGGLEEEGARALERFVERGGTLVCMNASAAYCIDALHLPVRIATSELGRDTFFSSGSILEVRADTAHPLMAGMRPRSPVFFDRSPVFTTDDGFTGDVVAAYDDSGSPLLSGYLLGEEHLRGRAAVVDVRRGNGHVVLQGLRPQWRGQPFGSFRVLFNALLYHGAVAREAAGTEGFWTPPASTDTLGTGGG